jgi:hypothetical protein
MIRMPLAVVALKASKAGWLWPMNPLRVASGPTAPPLTKNLSALQKTYRQSDCQIRRRYHHFKGAGAVSAIAGVF